MKERLLLPFLFFVLVSNTLPAVAGGGTWQAPADMAGRNNPVRYDPESVAKGKTLFALHCIECHGYWGEGDGIVGLTMDNRPANLLTLSGKQTPGEFAWKILEGTGEMPSFRDRLSEVQVWNIVNFITSLENESAPGGQSIVVRRCASCHGMAGKSFYADWPDLPEMSREQIEALLYAHRDGEFEDDVVSETMSKVTFDLTDEEIEEAAEYYSSLNRDRSVEGAR